MITSLLAVEVVKDPELSYQQKPHEDLQDSVQTNIETLTIIPENEQNQASDEELKLPLKT